MATSDEDCILETLSHLPPTATVEDAMERLYFLAKVERGVADLEAGRVVSHDEIKARYRLAAVLGHPLTHRFYHE